MAPLEPVTAGRKKRSPKSFVSFLSGATSGCLSTLALQPLDVVKTRMQISAAYSRSIHLQPALILEPNAGVIDTFRGIVRQDGVSGLWRGVTPSVLRNTVGVGVYFMTLNVITSQLSLPDGTLSNTATLFSGAFARSLAVVLLCPLSVIKTRMETVEYAKKYNGIIHAVRTISSQEGRRGLFSGLVPTILRDAPFSAVYMLFYLNSKEFLGRTVGLKNTRSSIVASTSPTKPSTSPSTAVSASHAQPDTQIRTSQETSSTLASQSDQSSSASSHNPPAMLMHVVNFSSGAFAGGLATLITQPLDVVKTRMQLSQHALQGHPNRYGGVYEALSRVFREEGVYGFFRGANPRFMKRILGSAITWMGFEAATQWYTKLLKRSHGGPS